MQLRENKKLFEENNLLLELKVLLTDKSSTLLKVLTKMNRFNKTQVGKNKMLVELKGNVYETVKGM